MDQTSRNHRSQRHAPNALRRPQSSASDAARSRLRVSTLIPRSRSCSLHYQSNVSEINAKQSHIITDDKSKVHQGFPLVLSSVLRTSVSSARPPLHPSQSRGRCRSRHRDCSAHPHDLALLLFDTNMRQLPDSMSHPPHQSSICQVDIALLQTLVQPPF